MVGYHDYRFVFGQVPDGSVQVPFSLFIQVGRDFIQDNHLRAAQKQADNCLLYTSDAADEL